MPLNKNDIDYTLYLVTDSTPAILGDNDICDVVEAALRGGTSCVQYRDKTSDTGLLVETACRLHALTRAHGVPLLINDRVDVALAVGCEGVHLGQSDLDVVTARRLLGPDKIIGISVSSLDELDAACKSEGRPDYLGIGTVFATSTKKDTKNIIGVDGLQEILGELERLNSNTQERIRTVCIGGVNASNASRVVWQSRTPGGRSLDGVAVVSAIMAATDPEAAARELKALVQSPPAFAKSVFPSGQTTRSDYLLGDVVPSNLTWDFVKSIISIVGRSKPLSHNMTNLVVQNFAANVALCAGASPIMANYGEEAKDLAQLGGSLVINMGTVTPEGLENYLKALRAYNEGGGPVVFDPVGAGATAVRRAAVKTILGAGYVDVIKGNESEILACFPGQAQAQPQQRGVDSGSTGSTDADKVAKSMSLAKLRRNIVVMTGETDYVSNGERTFAISNGHEYLGMVTGTGCCLGTVISTMLAAAPREKIDATVAALLYYEIAAEIAAERDDVKGPGSFVPAFLDELYRLRVATADGDVSWLKRARIKMYGGSHIVELQ